MEAKTKYKRIKDIGEGAFGTVYEVERNTDGKRLAEKVMKLPNNSEMVKFLNNNMREAFLLKELKHEHIIGFEDAFISNQN